MGKVGGFGVQGSVVFCFILSFLKSGALKLYVEGFQDVGCSTCSSYGWGAFFLYIRVRLQGSCIRSFSLRISCTTSRVQLGTTDFMVGGSPVHGPSHAGFLLGGPLGLQGLEFNGFGSRLTSAFSL